jgi:hypothetical protein
MKNLGVYLKQLRIHRILTVCLAAVVLFISTACNSGNAVGARPNNPPVQAGGANNPYKNGGDTNTNFNLSPDPKMKQKSVSTQGKRAEIPSLSKSLIASKEEGLLYPGAESPTERVDVEKSLPIKTLKDFETSQPGGQIQREDDFGDRVQDRLGAVKETFDKASDFINEGAKEALDNHETVPTPGLNKD